MATLQREIRCVGDGRDVGSVYFGGGTPALLSPGAVGALLEACTAAFALAANAEVTLEAHPGAVSRVYLRDLRVCGVNRLSLGVQSGHDDTLRRLGRWHTVAQARRALAWARQAGFDNVGVDLIYGLPGEGLERWRASLERVLSWEPDHVSAYGLAVEPGTQLARCVEAGLVRAADEDLMADMYELAGEILTRAGFYQYEISNWARPGMACRHNLHVWRGDEYLGFGAGAHGLAGGVRYRVVHDPGVYLRRMTQRGPCAFPLSPAAADARRLSERELMQEAMFLGLRLTEEGVSAGAFAARFGRELWEVFGAELDELLALGLLERHGDAVRLTPDARLVSNRVFMRFV